MNIQEQFEELTKSLGDQQKIINQSISKLPTEQKKVLSGMMSELNNAFKKKDVNLLNNLFEKVTKIAENESKVSK